MSRSRPAAVSSVRAIRSAARRMSSRSLVDLADDPDRQARAGERVPVDHRLGQAEREAELADLVLEQRPQRLDQRELQVVRQPADVVVRLDVRRPGTAAGLDDVRVERALDQELDVPLGVQLAGGRLEGADELAADDLALLLRVGDAGQRAEELVLRVDDLQPDAGGGDEVLLDLVGLTGALQPVVDVHTGQLVTDRLVTSAAATAESTPPDSAHSTCLSPTCWRISSTCSSTTLRGRPVAGTAGDVVQEVLQHGLPGLRVQHLRVPLHTGQLPVQVLERRDRRTRRRSQYGEARPAARAPRHRGTSRR